jgi:hypothetical protein
MILPEDVWLIKKPSEFRTLVALCHLAASDGSVEVSLEELGILTHSSRESLRRALRGLEDQKFIRTGRTRRNLGKLSTNKYVLCHKNEAWLAHPSHKNEASTHDQVVPRGISSITTSSNNDNNYSNCNESITSPNGEVSFKEIVVSKSKRWVPAGEDTSGDDELVGVGLFPDEQPTAKSTLSTDKRNPKTRGRRPESEWTPNDVASEFSFMLGRKFPLLPGLVNVRNLGGALARQRKDYKITAVIEMELMRMFFDDPRNLRDAEKTPHHLFKRYLRMFTTHLDEALHNVGLPPRSTLDMPDTVSAMVDEYIYASDGRKFDNSMPGRAALQRYERKLKQ